MKKILLIFFLSILNVKEAFSQISEIICTAENSVTYVDGVREKMEKTYATYKITKETETNNWCVSAGWRGLGSHRCSYLNHQGILSFDWYIPYENFVFPDFTPKEELEGLKAKENYERWLERKWKESYIIDIRNEKFSHEFSRINIYPKFYKGHIWSTVQHGYCVIK